ncbi:MAG: ATP phosphoribosyltransferase regulatory subunit [Clostridiales bacterium]|jgi:ATP phosphoribosyltransferase regulatory subunit|nr:ATP phosphoribosyltransferase regulatory subunit [Clostridiales bacterium]
MKDKQLHTPEGFRDFLPDECMLKRDVIKRVEAVFTGYGYRPVSSPMLEYFEVFDKTGSTPPAQMYRLFDREGGILTMRSDMTPPIVRIAATNYAQDDFPLRFFYTENSFRCHESYRGRAGEFTESGVELIGASGIEAEAEIIALAIQSLLAAGIVDFKVYIEHTEFFKGILNECTRLDDQSVVSVMETLYTRNMAEAGKLLRSCGASPDADRLIERLNSLTGGRKLLDELRRMNLGASAGSAVETLLGLDDILSDYGYDQYLFDFVPSGHLDYYTGIVFHGYARGMGFSALDGGRYDSLPPRFGLQKCGSAVGFAIKVDNLCSILNNKLDNNGVVAPADLLLAYAPENRAMALRVASQFRAQGLIVENAFEKAHTLEEAMDVAADEQSPVDRLILRARRKNISGVVYFGEGEQVIVANAMDGTRKLTSIQKLLREEL